MKMILANQPLALRSALLGAGVAGVVGAVAGLIIGLRVYPPTAPFAVLELGIPAAITGALAGLVAASVTLAARHITRRRRP